ncbi:Acid-sensing ion channel 5 [Exaiptasia diaphana]|nr:Acid-sensing ion channel 5 [Exaiptasia diaphana]
MNDRYNTDHSSEGEHSRGKQNEIELLQDFAQNTTMHGLHSVANSKTKLSKVIWLTLLSLSLFYMVKSTILSGKRYFSYPYTTEVGEEFAGKSGLKFPAITLCPMNMFVKTKIELQDEHRLFRKMGLNLKICDDTRKSRQRYNLSCGMFLMCNVGFYDMGGSNCGPETKTVLDDYLRNANNSSVINYEEQFRDIYGPNLEHSLEDCRFINRKCNASDFTKHVYTYGKCFQINNDKQNASWTFAYDKLFIVLDAKVHQYTKSPLFTEGFKFYVQAQGTFTSPRKGFVVSPGTIANVMVKQTKKTYLKHPYKSNCTERGLKSYSTYTILGCMNECFEDLKVKVCGCRSCGYFQHNSQIRVCTKNDLKCEQEISTSQSLIIYTS